MDGSTILNTHDLNATDPNYADAAAEIFRLLGGSPVIGAGLSGLTAGNNDMGAY
ncbi:MAG: hypothetical protein IVW54_09740 [Candidatus Binataceae bacterium]|nr:hypothetical protein [Candidatus Binataceae bacterium]